MAVLAGIFKYLSQKIRPSVLFLTPHTFIFQLKCKSLISEKIKTIVGIFRLHKALFAIAYCLGFSCKSSQH